MAKIMIFELVIYFILEGLLVVAIMQVEVSFQLPLILELILEVQLKVASLQLVVHDSFQLAVTMAALIVHSI